MEMANPIRKATTLAGAITWVVDGRRYGARPARPQFATKEQAEDALAQMIAKRGAGLSPTRRDVTFAMQADAYLKNAADALAGRSLRSYASILNTHLLPAFGAKRVVDINTASIRAFLAGKGAAKKPSGERQFSAATVRLLRATLSVILSTAVDDNLITANPVTAARVGSRGRKARIAGRVAIEKIRPFTEAQVTSLLEWCAAHDSELGDFLFTLLRTGMRPGEARALRWSDIHDDKVLVERSVDDLNVITPTKTGNVREVDLTPALKHTLRLRRPKRALAGHGAGDDDFVFGDGAPIAARAITHRFDRALRKCKVEGHVMYDCRHFYASVLLQKCRDVVYVAKMLGHSNPATTLKYYAHYLAATSTRFADQLDDQPLAATDPAEMNAAT
jgi:integrase